MKYAIQTWGSNGDIRPLIALAKGLLDAGHEVTMAISSIDNQHYDTYCQSLGIQTQALPSPIKFDMEDFAQRAFKMNPFQWLTALLDEVFLPYEALLYETAQALTDTHDVLIGHHLLYPMKLAAKQVNKPFVSVMFCPVIVKNPLQAPFHIPNLGRWGNLMAWKMLETGFNVLLKKRLAGLWNQQGVPVGSVIDDLLCSDQLNLIAVDPLFFDAKNASHPVHQTCGFLQLKEDAKQWSMPESLNRFLQQGEAPVYFTFGSLQQAVPEWSMDLFVETARRLKTRAIIQTSSARYPEGEVRDNCYFIARHPHQPVFEQCRAVVHHGGAGTSHTATLCGCPSVVVPFMDEQYFWGRQLQQLGVAGRILHAKHVNPDRLTLALHEVLQQPMFIEKAQRIGQQMSAHDGVQAAVQLLTNMQ